MKTITIELEDNESLIKFIIPTADMPDFIASQCWAGRYEESIEGDENPITPTQFAWERIKGIATDELAHYRKTIKVIEATKDIVIPNVDVKGL